MVNKKGGFMGTTAIFGFRYKGEEKYTICLTDGYPEGLGAALTCFILNTSRSKMIEIFHKTALIRSNDSQACFKYPHTLLTTHYITRTPIEWVDILKQTQGHLEVFKEGMFYMVRAHSLQKTPFKYTLDLDQGLFVVSEQQTTPGHLIKVIAFSTMNFNWICQFY